MKILCNLSVISLFTDKKNKIKWTSSMCGNFCQR